MKVYLISEKELNRFKQELLDEIREILNPQGQVKKKWIRSREVRKLLGNISHGKLQDMRNKGEIPFTRIGGTIFYNVDDVTKVMKMKCKGSAGIE